MFSRMRVPAIALLSLLVAAPAYATWSHDPMLGNNPVCIAPGTQNEQGVVSDGAGGLLSAWTDMRVAESDIYVQHLDAHGTALWGVGGMAAVNATNYQVNPAVVSDGAGGMILAWSDSRSGVSSDVYAMRIDSTGTSRWTAIICTAPDMQRYVRAVSDGAGGAIIGWQDRRNGNEDVYARRVKGDGTTLWGSNGVAVCNQADDQMDFHMACDAAGGAWFAWVDFRGGDLEIYAQRLNASGAVQLAANGQTVSADPAMQFGDVIAADGLGGLFLCWCDFRNGSPSDLYAQHLGPTGNPFWVSGGIRVATGTYLQNTHSVCADGQGGAIFAWQDERAGSGEVDLYGQHANFDGTMLWTANGIGLATGPAFATEEALLADGFGGAFITWADGMSGAYNNIYAQHVDYDGAPAWASRGVAVSCAPLGQGSPVMVDDGAGGFIVAWSDGRNTNVSADDLYAQRVDAYGVLGEAGPASLSVRDVANDQGGVVKLSWTRSWLDASPTFGVTEYRVWRSVPQAGARAVAATRGVTRDPDEAFVTRRLLLRRFGALDYAWEPVGSVVAAALPAYSLVAATTCDSTASANPRTAFMVEARGGSQVSSPHWFSSPDSGYSVDNLPPATPAAFTGQYAAGRVALHWQPNREPDLAGYRLYRGATPGFVANAGSLVATLSDTGHVDVAGAPAYYRLAAIDIHGNESARADLVPAGVLGVDDGAPVTRLGMSRARPNPAMLVTALDIELPAAAPVRLAVYDASGREVRTLLGGAVAPGRRTATWDLLDERGRRVPAGLYFARLVTRGTMRIERIVVLD